MSRILIILVALITMGTAANATTMAVGSLFGGFTQNQALCYFYNAGNSTVTISGKQIIREGFGPLAFTGDNCGVLAAGSICRFYVFSIVNFATHACQAVVDPDGAQVRGTLEIRNAGGTPLQTEQLR